MFKTAAEIEAYNKGVRAALEHARVAGQALSANPAWLPTRVPYAAAALDEFASAGEALLLPPAANDRPPR